MNRYERKNKITVKSATMIILENMQYSNYSSMEVLRRSPQKSKTQLEKFYNFNNKVSLREEAEKGKNYEYRFSIENILDFGTKWQGTSIRPIKIIDGESYEAKVPHNADVIAMVSYEAVFEDSYKSLEQSVSGISIIDSYPLFLSAVNKGIAAIEASIRDGLDTYNVRHPNDMLVDNFENKVSFNEKIDIWIPKITGKKFDKSTIVWDSFLKLKKLRNDNDQHIKDAYGFSSDEVLKLMNIYKYGIAKFLFELDRLFDRRTSSLIIRAQYFPEIVKIESEIS
ncbi:hypothetical protein [Erysipelothrix rhusiopathiae]|uniref:hypothetical protein n=1 Tax=Erysipelothrix rhusiopathiae TaxID=1648 RepID=UPI000F42DB35|nr:hypothetical protein [Erysipelothrix rhusiopathiae]AYV34220.1 hypothetical protein EEY85_02455 [Erysipelothrix rhusiopathiae]